MTYKKTTNVRLFIRCPSDREQFSDETVVLRRWEYYNSVLSTEPIMQSAHRREFVRLTSPA